MAKEKQGSMRLTLTRKLMNLHISLFRRTGGTLGGKLLGRPALILTTTGRKSGQSRATPLAYIPDDDRYLLIASNGGLDRAPSWWRNLAAHPEVKIEVGRCTISAIARTADAHERPELWSRIVEKAPHYASYQKKTTREIPVVIVTPVEQ